MAEHPDESPRFKPELPSIPGVPRSHSSTLSSATRTILVVSPLFILAAIIIWAVLRTSHAPARVSPAPPPALELPAPVASAHGTAQSPGEVAAIKDLAVPWSAKTFEFRKGATGENIPAIVIRLPGAPTAPNSYWAFALHEPFHRCQLEYITALEKLSTDYGFRATHPMVADPCNRSVFDPLELANLPSGAWARGAVVQGPAFRPPLGIEIRIVGDQLVAAQIE
jgi:hypothetical protein